MRNKDNFYDTCENQWTVEEYIYSYCDAGELGLHSLV